MTKDKIVDQIMNPEADICIQCGAETTRAEREYVDRLGGDPAIGNHYSGCPTPPQEAQKDG